MAGTILFSHFALTLGDSCCCLFFRLCLFVGTDVRRIYVYCIFFMRTVVTVFMLLVFHDMVVDRLSVLIDNLVVFFRLWPVCLGRMMDVI